MAELESAVALLVATVELSVVKSIRGAVRANLIAAGGVEGPLGTIHMPKPRGGTRTLNPEPRYEPRHVFRPEPRVEGQAEIQRRTVVRPGDPAMCRPCEAVTDLPAVPVHPVEASPLVPPWRMPMNVTPPADVRVIKYEAPLPDVLGKGRVLDLFL